MHDIYDPPPAPFPYDPPPPEPPDWRLGDLAGLLALVALLVVASVFAWRAEPSVAVLTIVGGSLVLVESWFTALGYLHRRPIAGLRGRWTIFAAALIPWLVGLVAAASLMLGLF